MVDPFAEVVTLLQPSAPLSKLVSGAGVWNVHRANPGTPFYCVVLRGACRLAIAGSDPVALAEGDFVMIPAAFDFVVSSEHGGQDALDASKITHRDGEVRHGDPDAPPDVQMLVGHFVFGSPDAALLVSLLPALIHVRGVARLSTIVKLVGDEARENRPAREVILTRLLEILLIEALRSYSGTTTSRGLLRGLSDKRLSAALRQMHATPTKAWTVAALAKEAALSRSAFFDRFNRAMGVTPMDYLLSWRMALAKSFLLRQDAGVAEIADRVGYRSASTFSVAFTRHVGLPPTHYVRSVKNLAQAEG